MRTLSPVNPFGLGGGAQFRAGAETIGLDLGEVVGKALHAGAFTLAEAPAAVSHR